MSGLVVTAAPLMSEARAYADLNGVRVYMLHKPGRGGGHYASVSASGGVNEVIAAICYGRILSDNLIFRMAAMQVRRLLFQGRLLAGCVVVSEDS